MKKPVCAILAFLIFGAVVNLAVAWASSWWKGDLPSYPYVGDPRMQSDVMPAWPAPVPSVWPQEPFVSSVRWGVGVRSWHALGNLEYEGRVMGAGKRSRTETGWPWRSMQWRDWSIVGASTVAEGEYRIEDSMLWIGIRVHAAAASPGTTPTQGTDRVLPLMPVWSGFVKSTLFFACAGVVIWYLPLFVKETSRRMRGRCVRCGYDLKGQMICPECGHEVAT